MTNAVEFLRASQIYNTPKGPGRIPISKSLWFSWVSTGFAPPPLKIGRISFWRTTDLDSFAERLSLGAQP
jgi:predicted DNA-binding transcriptional regulator AlpA